MTTKECIEQIEKCKFECEGGFLINNTGWIELKKKLFTELYRIVKLPSAEPVQYVGVYVLHWKDNPEHPEYGFVQD